MVPGHFNFVMLEIRSRLRADGVTCMDLWPLYVCLSSFLCGSHVVNKVILEFFLSYLLICHLINAIRLLFETLLVRTERVLLVTIGHTTFKVYHLFLYVMLVGTRPWYLMLYCGGLRRQRN